MVRYAQNCSLPCNPTVEESLRYQKQYKSAQKLVILSEDKLKMRMKSFLANHLVDVIQTFSLVSKGSQSKIFKLENQRKKSLYDERKNNLENIYTYFQKNSDLLKDLESELKRNFQHKIEEIFEKIKISLQSTIDTYETLVKNKIHSIQSQINQSLSNIQREMDKLKLDQRLKVSQTINGRLAYDQISKLLNVPQKDLRGYITILRMIEKGSPLMRKIAILEEDFTENDQFSCEREIDQLNINCSSINCGEMWNVNQLFKKKRDFETSFSSHPNSFSSVQNSFTSYQNPVSQHSLNMSVNEFQSGELNPQVEFILQDLIIKHEHSLKSLEQKIIHNLHAVFHQQHNVSNGEIRSQPLGLYLNQNKVYQIICQTKSSIEHLFKKVFEINKQKNSQFSTINKKQYYEPLMSNSQKQDSSDQDDDENSSQQMRENRNQHNLPLKRQQVPEVQKKQIVQEIQIKKKVQTILQTPHIEEVQQNVKSSSIFTFAGQSSNIQEQFRPQPQPINQQDIQQTRQINETSIRSEDQYESRIHYASQSQDQQENENENERQTQIRQSNQPRFTQPEIESQSESKKDEPSVAEQYSEYIRKMKQKGSRFQEQKQTENVSTYEKSIFINRQHQQEERKMQEYQKKLDRQEQWDKKNCSRMFEKDPSLMGDSRLRSYLEQQQIEAQIESSTNAKYPHNLGQQQKFIGQSVLENDPQKKRITEQWLNQRNRQKYKDFPQQRQEQKQLMQYVSYDYQPQNERQKPYSGSKSIKDQFLQGHEYGMQNILPEQISQYSDFDRDQQRKIQQSIRINNSMNLSREGNPNLRKFQKVINDVIVPGYFAFKKQRQTSSNQSLVRKAQQQEELQKSLLQLAIDDSLLQYESNQNKSLNSNKISQIKQTDPKNNRFFQQPRIPSNRQFENNFEQDFTNFQEFFKEMSTIKAPFSYQENSGFNFLDELEQDIRRPFARRRLNDEMQIKDIKIRQEEMDISKEEFSIVVRVLKPVLLTFKSMDKQQNSPMAKFIVGDQTGIAVLYMRYYCDVKPGLCLKLNRCRVCKYRSSFEITNVSRITTVNVLPGNFISQIKYNNPLSLVRGSSINDLSYEVRPYFNDLLRDCVRDMLRNGNQRQQFLRKPLILTVCDANIQMRRYLLGDYTGRIVAQMDSCTKLMAKHETVLIKNIRICIRGDRILLVGQRGTMILKADFDWQFKHDLQYIPNEQFKMR